MSTHNPHKPGEIDASKGYEASDVRVSGVVVFMVALTIFAAAAGMLAYGVGKVLNARMKTEDGPPNRWARPVDVRPLGNMPSNPEMQSKLNEMTQSFPTPKLQTDDGSQDVADLHAREDLLLNNYSWADEAHSKVRIPIERAMELIAQRGLPVAKPVEQGPLMTGDKRPVIAVPLTNGFARTGYELEQAADVRPEAHK
ncbi:MAG TPA: hypothetical protein VKF63_01035 [Terracidiphilus sp.]|nr:hypothetical protein [Terracidiphilus sp.]